MIRDMKKNPPIVRQVSLALMVVSLVVALGANGAYEAVTKLPDRMAAKPTEDKQTEKE